MKNGICAIIITYNIGKDLLKCFNSIEKQVNEVVLVDNGSGSKTISILENLEKTRPNVKVFYNQENLGIATALNIAVKYTIDRGHTWILTLDHDSVATPRMVETLLTAFKTLGEEGVSKVGIIAPIPFDTNIQEYLIDGVPRSRGVQEVRRVISSGSMVNSHVFEEVGFFNEKLFMYYVDDDFCIRCRSNKWKIYLCHSAVLLHQEGAREVKKFLWKKIIYRRYDGYATYYRSRNVVYMLKNHHSYEKYFYRTFILTCTVIRRICFDAMKIILFDKQRFRLLSFMIKGISDGITGKYGKIVEY